MADKSDAESRGKPMLGAGGKAGLLAGVAGISTVAGVSAAKALRQRRLFNDAYEGEDFKLLDADRGCVVTTPDGTSLVVREVGPVTAPLTVVFTHGFCVRMGSFHFQRLALAQRLGTEVRMVFYDQRGHGQSAAAPPETYTVPQLGVDLETVLQVMVPVGPVVLVGHSMGGMSVLSQARQFPRRYPRRVVGAALISSAAEGLARSPLGEALQNPALEAVRFAARWAPWAVHRTRGAIRSLIRPIIRDASFGSADVSPRQGSLAQSSVATTAAA
jgi:pimeloyl-ACP methyl ester carboxylesterase